MIADYRYDAEELHGDNDNTVAGNRLYDGNLAKALYDP